MAKATLTTLTPIHVGSGQTLNKNIDFGQEGNKVGRFNLDKIVRMIGVEQIAQLTNVIEKGESMLDFLRKGRCLSNPFDEFCDRIFTVNNISTTTTQLKEHYRTSLMGVCIPGSSLKGAIKTAIWESILTDDILQQTLVSNLKNRRGNWSDQDLNNKLFGRQETEKTTRFIKISDIQFPKVSTEIFETIILNQKFNNWEIKSGNRFLLECIPANSKTEFELKLDEKLFNENKKRYPATYSKLNTDFIENDFKRLVNIINSFTKLTLEWDITELEEAHLDNLSEGSNMLDVYESICNTIDNLPKNECIIRLGGNNGWKFTTGGWVTKKTLNISNEDYNAIKKVIQKRYYPEGVLLPKTRKTTSTGIPFGFVKITIESS